jgi:glycosyltransferase involved in cell wall biosynthesis
VRVLHVSDHYPPVLGGIERHVAALAERQALRGDDVAVLTSSRATADGRHSEDSGTVAVRRVRSRREVSIAELAAYDVLHAHVSVVAPFTAPLVAAAARRGVPTIVTVHSLWSRMGPLPAAAARLAGLRTAPVRWTSVSGVAAVDLAARLPAGTEVEVLPNAVDVRPRPRTPDALPGDPVRLVSTMRIARRKRPLALLRAFELLARTVDVPLELTMVGDGPRRPEVERLLDRSAVGHLVTVTGRVEPDEVLGLLARADVYVAPAILESFGLAALEARSVGLPVVGRADNGLTDFVRHEREGLLCPSDEGMVSALRRLVHDTDLRHRMSEHNRTVAPSQTWAQTLADHDTAYARTVDDSVVPGTLLTPPEGGR